jgi:purine-cytosine permease-like protein
MGIAAFLIVGIYVISTLIAVVLIIYLIIKRRNRKKTEDFEKRENEVMCQYINVPIVV